METWAKHLVSPKILWITRSLISWALCQGEKAAIPDSIECVWERVFLHVCMTVYVHSWCSVVSPLLCLLHCWLYFLGVCVYSERLDSSRIYVYSMCFCNYKGIFHSVMLINLISKSRNMKQELKNRLPLWLDVRQHMLSANFFFSAQLFSLSNSKTF